MYLELIWKRLRVLYELLKALAGWVHLRSLGVALFEYSEVLREKGGLLSGVDTLPYCFISYFGCKNSCSNNEALTLHHVVCFLMPNSKGISGCSPI